MNPYETDKLLAEYLLFHFGSAEEILPACASGLAGALHYPARCVTECVDLTVLPVCACALDLGCAVGRASFELARTCTSVVGIDFSQRFIAAAQCLARDRELPYAACDEGELATRRLARVPAGVETSRVTFEQGDAMNLRADLGTFDVVLLANLIDRLREPARCLARLPTLVKPGGQLVITSPYTWLEEFTPRAHWLGGFRTAAGLPVTTRDGLQSALGGAFELTGTKELPFLLREHSRKFQWSLAEATMWRRRATRS